MNTILLIGHGSRDPEGNEQLLAFAEAIAARVPDTCVETCFLELTRPTIAEGVTACVNRGATRVVLIPIILFAAGHAKIDIPMAIDRAKAKYPEVEFVYGRPIGVHEKIVRILETRLEGAAAVLTAGNELSGGTSTAVADVADEDTAVLVLGRGSSDPDANSDFYKITRMLWEKLPYKWVESSFIGVTQPSFPEGLERCLRLGAKKIIVLPYFLFTGVLIKRIQEMTLEFAEANPDTVVEMGDYFGFHPQLEELVLERANEGLNGRVMANCDNCQFRLIAQEHHHHHHHDHDHDHGHDHDHHHDHHHDHDHDHDHSHHHHHGHEHHAHGHDHDHHDHSHDHDHEHDHNEHHHEDHAAEKQLSGSGGNRA
ncbi:sirohydrochlorin chelatase [Paenibacillus massiliensis]|uniref:sirohydrochlorin chelatase n=1 Tax=Paenibacillus massiliensis TaxID=225917 RepID=UPI00040A4952|nr:sirohydrochlorin chelatase [Paenibacillus massiliensis]